MEWHDLANLLPSMSDTDLGELAEDIKRNGQHDPIVLFESKVLDGRHRWLACQMAGVSPKTRQFDGDCVAALNYVKSINIKRRHLTTSQAAAVAVACSEREQELREEAAERMLAGVKPDPSQIIDEGSSPNDNRTDEQLAKEFGTNRQYVADARKIKQEFPETHEKVLKGELTIPEAKREIKRTEVRQSLESVAAKEAKAAQGVYDVIVCDPPWPMKKIERDVAPEQVDFDYPVMTEDELHQLSIPCASDCHLWLWTTHKFLPMALRLIESWGFKYVCTFTWHKPGGFQPFGLPQYNCEFAVYCRKGTPQFLETKKFPVCFNAARGGHSEKPEEFYELLRRVTGGRRLDMFNRRPIDGFDGWGKESPA